MLIELKDENGKQISVDPSKSIYYLTDDMESESNACFMSADIVQNSEQIKTQILNADGSIFSINDSEDSMDDITDIDIYIEASHSDTKINSGFYSGDSMLRDSESYILPFGKPMIKNHDSHSEPLGRIVEAQCTDSAFVDGVKAMDVRANITDKEAIPKFMDGRYKTVSIGANPKTIVCNHCGKHILKDNKFKFCGHWRGETYNEKECTWKLEDLEYTELSVVNKPADRNAQVYKIVVHRKSDKVKNSDEKNEIILDDLTNEILNTIPVEEIKDNENDITENVDDTVIENNDEDTVTENSDEELSKDDMQLVIDSLNNKINSLSDNINNLQKTNKELNDNNTILSIDNDTLSSKLEELTTKVKSISDMYKTDLMSVLELNNEEERTFAEIKENFNNFLVTRNNICENVNNEEDNSLPSNVKPAINPGLANNEDDSVIKEEEDAQTQRVRMNISFDSVINSLIK